MKFFRFYFLFFLVYTVNLIGQQSCFQIKDEFLLGVNSTSKTYFGQTYSFEIKTPIFSAFILNLSAGYQKIYINRNITLNSYTKIINQGHFDYSAVSYKIKKNEYDFVPVSFGVQYNYPDKTFYPYLITAVYYNFINGKSDITETKYYGLYESLEQLPENFRTKHKESLPNHSYGVSMGVGIVKSVNANLDFDLRYLLKWDDRLGNSHHFLIGILF
ncbi:MAG: hypothetical protein Fur0015_08810 [Ignavibacteriales bacterium]